MSSVCSRRLGAHKATQTNRMDNQRNPNLEAVGNYDDHNHSFTHKVAQCSSGCYFHTWGVGDGVKRLQLLPYRYSGSKPKDRMWRNFDRNCAIVLSFNLCYVEKHKTVGIGCDGHVRES